MQVSYVLTIRNINYSLKHLKSPGGRTTVAKKETDDIIVHSEEKRVENYKFVSGYTFLVNVANSCWHVNTVAIPTRNVLKMFLTKNMYLRGLIS